MGTHLKVLGKSYPMNTNMAGFRWFTKNSRPCALDESRLSIGRVKKFTELYDNKNNNYNYNNNNYNNNNMRKLHLR